MSATDDLATLQANNTADATTLTSLEQELTTPAVDSVGDQVLAAIVPVLESAGYTVTAPEPETPAEDATDTPTEA
jgi:hypothetical protein